MMPSTGDRVRAAPYVVLGIAWLAASCGAICARLAEAPPLAIAAWRVGLALIVVMPFAAAGIVGPGTSKRARALAAGAGILLAAHFATWIASLEYTTVARSVLFVCTAPIWVALLEFLSGRGAPTRATLLALVLALAGTAVVSGGGHGGTAAL